MVALTTCTVVPSPTARSPSAQFNVWFGALPEMEHAAFAGEIDQSIPVPPGSASVIDAFLATPGPALVTATVKPMSSPAFTVVASAVFVICNPGASTMMLPVSQSSFGVSSAAPFVSRSDVAVQALLSSSPAFFSAVAAVTVTSKLAPDASVPTSQCRCRPLIAQPATAGSIVHASPLPSGRSSSTVTSRASPAPLFVTSMVNAAVSPALMCCASGVFVRTRSGWTTTVALVVLPVGPAPSGSPSCVTPPP